MMIPTDFHFLWVLIGTGIVLIGLRTVSTWAGEKFADVILYIISFTKRHNISTQSPRYIWRYAILMLTVFWILTILLIIYLVVWK